MVAGSPDNFNSRPSARGDLDLESKAYRVQISIHAPPRGATLRRWNPLRTTTFQFTPLREGRRAGRPDCGESGHFNSRPSARGDVEICGNGTVPRPISIHAPPRGATSALQRSPSGQLFQFTPLREGRRPFRGREVLFRRISIHAPPRGATTVRAPMLSSSVDFNSRPSARGDSTSNPRRTAYKFQFTPLREGRRPGAFPPLVRPCISIHAPPRGATSRRPGVRASGKFQFTPLREGRHDHDEQPPRAATTFQFTPLREGRHGGFYHRHRRHDISIHAPPRGATRNVQNGSAILPTFQFTPFREGRPAPCKGRLRGSYFNSRPSARGDRDGIHRTGRQEHFNSRPSARGDDVPVRERFVLTISIHAPPRGATLLLRAGRELHVISIHAPPRGATSRAKRKPCPPNFNSRPSARGDLMRP